MFFSDYSAFKFEDIFRIKRKAEYGNGGQRAFASVAYRISGESVFHFNDMTYNANSGSLIYIPENIEFSRESTEEELYIIHLSSCNSAMNSFDIIYPDRTVTMELLDMMYKEYREKLPGYMHRCSSLIYTLLARLQSTKHILSPYKYNLIQRGIEYINSHFDDSEISIGNIAEMCNISPEYFRKLFKEEFGISPQKAINNKRIEKSCKLLQSGYYTVKEVAEYSGFADVKSFSTFFKKNIKATPKEYELMYKNNM